jgi:hypothetical protein
MCRPCIEDALRVKCTKCIVIGTVVVGCDESLKDKENETQQMHGVKNKFYYTKHPVQSGYYQL